MSHTFAVNLTNTHVSLKVGYAIIPASGFLKIHKEDMNRIDFRDAEDRGWIEYSDTEPTLSKVTGPTLITSNTTATGMSETELKEMLGKTDNNKNVATVTNLGKKEDTTEPQEAQVGDEIPGVPKETTEPPAVKTSRKTK
jgi:hypothetical protein